MKRNGEPRSDRPRVVVIGSGVAALEFVLALRALAPAEVEVEVIASETHFAYRPFAVAETFGFGEVCRLDLAGLAEDVHVLWRRGRVRSIDQSSQCVVTDADEQIPYDLLLVACGATAERALPGALTFRGEEDEAAFRDLLAELESGAARSAAFVVPSGSCWPLPLYELALMTATRLLRAQGRFPHLAVVTPEESPLALFGSAVSRKVDALLARAGIQRVCARHVAGYADGILKLVPKGELPADRAVTLPHLHGPRLSGVPHDSDGFIPVDLHGRVHGSRNVFAAGDATAFPVKHGGLAIAEAAAAAECVAAELGAAVRPVPFRPLLRGLLLTGAAPWFLWSEAVGGRGDTSEITPTPLWWPPGKLAGGYLTRYLHSQGIPVTPPPAGRSAIPIDLELDAIAEPAAAGGDRSER